MDAQGKRFAIVASRWNEFIVKELVDGALDELRRHGTDDVEVFHVPGTWEIPPVVQALYERPAETRPHGIIALGCILQGATTHAQLLSADVSNTLMRMQVEYKAPVAWGILTPESTEQAIDRSGMKMGNKGREAALAAIELANVLEEAKGH